jgi:Fe-S cluster assembly protein SufB
MTDQNKILSEVTQSEYKYGFFLTLKPTSSTRGLNEAVVRTIWEKKNEPDFMLDFQAGCI